MSSTVDHEPTTSVERPILEPISTSTEHTDSLSADISENPSKTQHAKSIGTTTPEVEGEEQEPIAAVEEYPTTPVSPVDPKSDSLLRLTEPKNEEAPLPPQPTEGDKIEDYSKEAEEKALPQLSNLEDEQLGGESQPSVEAEDELLPKEQPTSETEETSEAAGTEDKLSSDDSESKQIEEEVIDQEETPLGDKEELSVPDALERTGHDKPTPDAEEAKLTPESKLEVSEPAVAEGIKPLEEESSSCEGLGDTPKLVSEGAQTLGLGGKAEETFDAPSPEGLGGEGLNEAVVESSLEEFAAVLPSGEGEGDPKVQAGSKVVEPEEEEVSSLQEVATSDEVSPAAETVVGVPLPSEPELEPVAEPAKTESGSDVVEEARPVLDMESTNESPVEELPKASETLDVVKEGAESEETHGEATPAATPLENSEQVPETKTKVADTIGLETNPEGTTPAVEAVGIEPATEEEAVSAEEKKPAIEEAPVIEEAVPTEGAGIIDEATELVSDAKSGDFTGAEPEAAIIEKNQTAEEKSTAEEAPVVENKSTAEKPAAEEPTTGKAPNPISAEETLAIEEEPAVAGTLEPEESTAVEESQAVDELPDAEGVPKPAFNTETEETVVVESESATIEETQDIEKEVVVEAPIVDDSPAVEEAPELEAGVKTEEVEGLMSELSSMEKDLEEESLASQETSTVEESEQIPVEEKLVVEDSSIGGVTTVEETPIVDDTPKDHESPAHGEKPTIEEAVIDREAPVEGTAATAEKAVVTELSTIEEPTDAEREPTTAENPMIEAAGGEAIVDDESTEATVSPSELEEAVVAEPVSEGPVTTEMQEQGVEEPQTGGVATVEKQGLGETEETGIHDQGTTPAHVVDNEDKSSEEPKEQENVETIEPVKGEAPPEDVETMAEPSTEDTIPEELSAADPTITTGEPSPKKSEAQETKVEPPLEDLAAVTEEPFEAESKSMEISQPAEETPTIERGEFVNKESVVEDVPVLEEVPFVEERPIVEDTTVDEEPPAAEEKLIIEEEPATVAIVGGIDEETSPTESKSIVKEVPVEEITAASGVLAAGEEPIEEEAPKETAPTEISEVRAEEKSPELENASAFEESEEKQAVVAVQEQGEESEVKEEVPAPETSAVTDNAEQAPVEPVEVPKVVVELTVGNQPSHGDDLGSDATPGQQEAFEKRKADAEPDQLVIVEEPSTPEIVPIEEANAEATSAESERGIVPESLQEVRLQEPAEVEHKTGGSIDNDHEIKFDQAPTVEETPAVEQVPAVEETPVVQEGPGAEQAITVEAVPAVEEGAHIVEETRTTEGALVAQRAPVIEQVPAVEEAPPVEGSAAEEEVPTVEDDAVIISHDDAKPEDVAEAEAAVKVPSFVDDRSGNDAAAAESVPNAPELAVVVMELPQSSEELEEEQHEVPVSREEPEGVPDEVTSIEKQAEDLSQEVSVHPFPASEALGNPIGLAPGGGVPEIGTSSTDPNVKLDQESYEKADTSNVGVEHGAEPEEIFSVKPLPDSEAAGNPIELQPGQSIPDIGSASIESNVKLDQGSYEKAGASNFGITPEAEVFSVKPLPASETATNPIDLKPGELVPNIGSASVESNIRLDEESYEKADASNFGIKSPVALETTPDEAREVSINPFPASQTSGNPIELQPGEPIPNDLLNAESTGANVKLDEEAYQKADASNFGVLTSPDVPVYSEVKDSEPIFGLVDTIKPFAGAVDEDDAAKKDDAKEVQRGVDEQTTAPEADTLSMTAKDTSEAIIGEPTEGKGKELEESTPTETNKVEAGLFVDKSTEEVTAPVEPDSNASIVAASVLSGVATLSGSAAITAIPPKDKPSSSEAIVYKASSRSTEDIKEQAAAKQADEDFIMEPAPQTAPSPVHGITIPEADVKQAVADADTSSAPAIFVSPPPVSPTVGNHQEGEERTVEVIEPTPEGSGPKAVEQESENTPAGVRRRLDGSGPVSRPVSSGNDTVSTRQHKNVMRAFWNVLFLNWFGGLFNRMFGRKKSRATS